MTFDDDFVRIPFADGRELNIACKSLKMDWPPPKRLNLFGTEFERVSMSAITDEERALMTNVNRGALYKEVPGGKPTNLH